MSRSSKKYGWAGDKKRNKEIANRKYRRKNNFISKGNFYRKNYPQYDICDFGGIAPSYDAFCQTNYAQKFPTEKAKKWAYQKIYFMK